MVVVVHCPMAVKWLDCISYWSLKCQVLNRYCLTGGRHYSTTVYTVTNLVRDISIIWLATLASVVIVNSTNSNSHHGHQD